MEGSTKAPLVKTQHELVRHVVDACFGVIPALRWTNTVARQVFEQRAAVLCAINIPRLAPRHDALGQHVIHHGADQAENPEAAPEPLVDPALNDGQVVRILLEHELDAFKPQGHMPCFVRLGREAEGHRGHVTVVSCAGHERHEQQVGQHVFEREADGDHELERTGRHRIVKERTRHGRVPDAVTLISKRMEAVVELVVVG